MKTIIKTFRISPKLVEQLKKQMEKERRSSMSDMITICIEDYISKHGLPKKTK